MQSVSDWQIHYHWGLWRPTKIPKLGHWEVFISLYLSLSHSLIHILFLRTISKTPLCRCTFGSEGYTILSKHLVSSWEVFSFFFLSFNTIITLVTIDSKDNTDYTRQDKPRKISGPNACGQKDEKVLHEWGKYMSFILDALDQCLGHRFHSMRILKMWLFYFWKQRTSKYFAKERVFFEVKHMSHVRLKIKIAPIYYCFLGGTHKAT